MLFDTVKLDLNTYATNNNNLLIKINPVDRITILTNYVPCGYSQNRQYVWVIEAKTQWT